jgi:hypothetical protein
MQQHCSALLKILVLPALFLYFVSACSASTLEPSQALDTATPAAATGTFTAVPPTATGTATYTPVPPTATQTASPTSSPTATGTATATLPPPTPSGEDAIYIYYIQLDTGGPVSCGDSLVPVNTGLYRSGDVEADVAAALRRLFSKVKGSGELVNPAYLSNIEVVSVTFKPDSGLVDVRLSGTYVRSGDRCDDSRVRAQVWTTIRQFPGVEEVYILLRESLLGDLLATGK